MAQAFRSTRVLTPEGLAPATRDCGGRAHRRRCARWDEVPADAELRDFGDSVLLPGLVDSHVHINEPGRTEWEGFWTATRAAAAGGVTTLVDMPLNCVPETIDVEALEAKRAAAQGKTWVDWAAWGGVVRGNADALAGAGAGGRSGLQVLPDPLRHRRLCVGRRSRSAPGAGQAARHRAAAAGPRRSCRPGGRGDRSAERGGRGLAQIFDLSGLAARRGRDRSHRAADPAGRGVRAPIHIVHLVERASTADARRRARPRRAHHRGNLRALSLVRGRRDSRRRDGIQMRAAHSRRGQSRSAVGCA